MSKDKAETSPRRRRGAQPGNTNALRHGLYARSFRQIELADLDALTLKISDEIVLLRVMTRRLLEYVNSAELDTREMIAALNALGATAIRIASLTRTQTQLNGDTDATSVALSQALAQAFKELDIK